MWNFLRSLWLEIPIGLFAARGTAMLAAFTTHELAHGLAATIFGDPTPREQSRLTLNPGPHLESLGAILAVLTGLGWSRPTPIRPYRMRRPNALFGLLAAAAGPAASLGIAKGIAALMASSNLSPAIPWHNWPTLAEWLTVLANLNLMLAVLNLLPLYPLDGYHAIHNILPLRPSAWWEQISGLTSLVFGVGLFLFLWLPTAWISAISAPPIHWLRRAVLGW